MSNPFHYMPKVGTIIEVPGGFFVCQRITVDLSHSKHAEGEVAFQFMLSREAYEAMKAPRELPEPRPSLPDQTTH